MSALHQQTIEKQIKIIQKGKVTSAKNLRPGDVIIKAKDTPMWIPGLPNTFDKVTNINKKDLNLENTKTRKKFVKNEDTNLWIPGLSTDFSG